jgi:hypothetical protein
MAGILLWDRSPTASHTVPESVGVGFKRSHTYSGVSFLRLLPFLWVYATCARHFTCISPKIQVRT